MMATCVQHRCGTLGKWEAISFRIRNYCMRFPEAVLRIVDPMLGSLSKTIPSRSTESESPIRGIDSPRSSTRGLGGPYSKVPYWGDPKSGLQMFEGYPELSWS